MHIHVFIILMLWLLACSSLWGQTLVVKDKETEKPIAFATISSNFPKKNTVTNARGEAEIARFQHVEKIEIRSLGYQPVYISYQELQADKFLVLLQVANLSLDELVISANKWQQVSSEVAAAVTTVSPSQVAMQQPQTAADLLAISGKVFVQKSQQGGGSPMIRGFAANRLFYSVDGIRMNTAIFRAGNLQNVINLDPFAIENTEIIFGPGSVIYGSDAIGGSMNFQTLAPQLAVEKKMLVNGKAVARYASANQEKTSHFDINLGWKKWALVSSVSHWDFDHLRQGAHGPDDYLKPFLIASEGTEDIAVMAEDPRLQNPSGYSQLNLMQKVRFSPSQQWDVQYGFHYSATSSYGRYDRHNRMRNGLPMHAEWDYGPQKWMMNNLKISHNGYNFFYDNMDIRLAYQKFEESRIDRNYNDPIRRIRQENVAAYSANVDFSKSAGAKHSLYYGFEWVHNKVSSSGTDQNIINHTKQPGPARYPQANWYALAAYISNVVQVSDKLNLQSGLRLNHFGMDARFDTRFYPFPFTEASRNHQALTGSLGMVYRPDSKWVIRSTFGTGFRAPNVDDMGKVFDSEPGAVTVPNPNLDAEYVYNWDLGLAKIFAESLKIELTGYVSYLQNAMVRRNFQLNGQDSIFYDGLMSNVQAIQNAANAQVFGVQWGMELTLPAGFLFTTDLNLQHGQEELDDGSRSPSRHVAPFFGVSRLNFKANKLSLQLYSTYQGQRRHAQLAQEERAKTEIYASDENGKTFAPAWYTINFKGVYQATDLFAATIGVENITDQRYRPYSSGISGPERNFIAAISLNF